MAGPPVALSSVAPPLVGRTTELETALERIASGLASNEPTLVVLEGPAGIGKTSVHRAILETARGRGLRVLRASPSQAETNLAYAGLADLLDGIPDDPIDLMPVPQRHAMRVATLREDAGSEPVDPRTVGTALLNLLRRLAAVTPVVLAIDDVQWLDAGTAAALTFALRRASGSPLAVVVGLRTDDAGPGLDAPVFEAIAGAIAIDRQSRIVIGPLSTGALFQLLRDHLGHAFARPTLVRIAEWSGGSPLLAIELGRIALRSGGVLGPEAAAELPRTVTAAVAARLSMLPEAEARAVLIVACGPDLTDGELASVASRLGWSVNVPDDPAVLRREGGRLRIGHPVIASQAIALATKRDRGAVHRALSEVVTDPVARAWHLALAVDDADAGLASSLDAGVRAASARGASETAIDLATLACDRTPPGDAAALLARRRALGELLLRAGDTIRAGKVLGAAAAMPLPGPERALAKVALAEVESHRAGLGAAASLCAEAAREAGDDPLVAGRVELAWSAWSADARDGLGHARRAVELLQAAPLALRARSLANLVASLSEIGEVVPNALLAEALRLEAVAPLPRILEGPAAAQAWLSLLADDLASAHAQYEALREGAADVGDETSLARILVDLAQIDLRWGRWAELHAHAAEAIEVAERSGLERFRILGIIQLGALAASRGDRREAERHLGEAVAFGRAGGHPFIEAAATGNLGTLALGEGRFELANDLLAAAAAGLEGSGIADMALSRFQGDRLEALVGLGRLDEARELADLLEEQAGRNLRRRPLALVARGRGLIAAAGGDSDAAIEHLSRSIEALDALEMPFEAARSRLARASVHRRRRAKRLAAADLDDALHTFERLGATVWSDRARTEHGRLGLRPHAPSSLTDTEATVARLAADGLTSREIAAAAFMSPRTVEGVLARVYGKLGVGSRAELGRAMAVSQRGPGGVEAN